MSKHNYSQYSNNNKKNFNNDNSEVKVADVQPEVPVIDESNVAVVETVATPEIKKVPETAEPVAPRKAKTVKGVVANCAKLNVRVKPSISADVVTVLNSATEVEINADKSNKDWFFVRTAAGVEGYCMRKFVSARL